MPLQSDDYYDANGKIVKGDAPAKANRYGRVQNRLLLGNRNGVNLQLAPEKLPAAPYSPLYLQASGLTALYRANGTNWAFDSKGIVCSVDALFWGAVGGTGTFWFPVAPGITTLPAEPPIVDGAMNANTVVLPYNETAIYDSRIRLPAAVTKFDYSLNLLTEVPAAPIKIKTVVQRVLIAAVGSFSASGQPAATKKGSKIVAALGSFSLTPQDATLRPLRLISNAGSFAINGQPALLTSSNGDPSWTQVQLMLHMNGTNGGTTFTDTSVNSNTVTVFGNTSISTTQSKFGGAAGYFDGNGDYLRLPNTSAFDFTSAFTIEAWVYLNAYTSPWGTVISRYFDAGLSGYRIISNSTGWQFSFVNASSTVSSVSGSSISLSTWTHIAVTYDGAVYRVFTAGNLSSSLTTSLPKAVGTSFAPVIGSTDTINWFFNGYIDDLRITKGTARYTASFTPPTAAFPDYPQTV